MINAGHHRGSSAPPLSFMGGPSVRIGSFAFLLQRDEEAKRVGFYLGLDDFFGSGHDVSGWPRNESSEFYFEKIESDAAADECCPCTFQDDDSLDEFTVFFKPYITEYEYASGRQQQQQRRQRQKRGRGSNSSGASSSSSSASRTGKVIITRLGSLVRTALSMGPSSSSSSELLPYSSSAAQSSRKRSGDLHPQLVATNSFHVAPH